MAPKNSTVPDQQIIDIYKACRVGQGPDDELFNRQALWNYRSDILVLSEQARSNPQFQAQLDGSRRRFSHAKPKTLLVVLNDALNLLRSQPKG